MTLSDSEAASAPPADDLRASIEAAFNAQADAPSDELKDDASPARDDAGRFAKGEGEAEEQAETPDETKDETRQPEGASKPERIAAPNGWPSDARLAWDKLPRAAQEALRADLDAGRLSLASRAQGEPATDPVREVVKAYDADLARMGVAPETAVKRLFEAQRYLDANPVEGLKWLARSYGVDLTTLAAAGGQVPQHPADPIAQVDQKVEALRHQLAQEQRAREEAKAQAELADVARNVEAFAAEKDEAGNLLRPHFAEVKVMMGRLLENGTATNLADAYEKAVYANPKTRALVLEAERKAEAAKRDAEARKAAVEAKRKAASVSTNPSVTAGPQPADTLRAELERAFAGG